MTDRTAPDPWAGVREGVQESIDITRELAERGPFLDTNGDLNVCADCQVVEGAKGDRPLTFSEMHEPRCLWRRAKALYPGAMTA